MHEENFFGLALMVTIAVATFVIGMVSISILGWVLDERREKLKRKEKFT